MSKSASWSGRRYGFTFSAMSPGRNPSFSPASTAGRASTIRFTSFRRRNPTAMAIARKVFPVPAGPTPKTMSKSRMASRYRFCATLFGVIILFREDLKTTSWNTSETSAFRSTETMRLAASTSFPATGMPRRSTRYSPESTFPASSTGIGSPATRASPLPGRITTPRAFSRALRCASCGPKSVGRTAGSSNRIVSSRASVNPPPPFRPVIMSEEPGPARKELPGGRGEEGAVEPHCRGRRAHPPQDREDRGEPVAQGELLPEPQGGVLPLRDHRAHLHQAPLLQRCQPLAPLESRDAGLPEDPVGIVRELQRLPDGALLRRERLRVDLLPLSPRRAEPPRRQLRAATGVLVEKLHPLHHQHVRPERLPRPRRGPNGESLETVLPVPQGQHVEEAFPDLESEVTGEHLPGYHPLLHEEFPDLLPAAPLGVEEPLHVGVGKEPRIPKHGPQEGPWLPPVGLDVHDHPTRKQEDRDPVVPGDGEGAALPLRGNELEDFRDAEIGDFPLHVLRPLARDVVPVLQHFEGTPPPPRPAGPYQRHTGDGAAGDEGLQVRDQPPGRRQGAQGNRQRPQGGAQRDPVRHRPQILAGPQGAAPGNQDGTGLHVPPVQPYVLYPPLPLIPAADAGSDLCPARVADVGGFPRPCHHRQGAAGPARAVEPDLPGEEDPRRNPEASRREERGDPGPRQVPEEEYVDGAPPRTPHPTPRKSEKIPPAPFRPERGRQQLAVGHLLGPEVERGHLPDACPGGGLYPVCLFQPERPKVQLVCVPVCRPARRRPLDGSLEIRQRVPGPAEPRPDNPPVVVRTGGILPVPDQLRPHPLRSRKVSRLHLRPGLAKPLHPLPRRNGRGGAPCGWGIRPPFGKISFDAEPCPRPGSRGQPVEGAECAPGEKGTRQQEDRRQRDRQFPAPKIPRRKGDPEHNARAQSRAGEDGGYETAPHEQCGGDSGVRTGPEQARHVGGQCPPGTEQQGEGGPGGEPVRGGRNEEDQPRGASRKCRDECPHGTGHSRRVGEKPLRREPHDVVTEEPGPEGNGQRGHARRFPQCRGRPARPPFPHGALEDEVRDGVEGQDAVMEHHLPEGPHLPRECLGRGVGGRFDNPHRLLPDLLRIPRKRFGRRTGSGDRYQGNHQEKGRRRAEKAGPVGKPWSHKGIMLTLSRGKCPLWTTSGNSSRSWPACAARGVA